jgi:hypothetical protein
VAITEIGSATYTGAAGRGARGGEVIQWDDATAMPRGIQGGLVRDEAEQAAAIRELLTIVAAAGVDSSFVFTFVQYTLPHRPDPRDDLDMGAYSIVKAYEGQRGTTYPDMPWEPKAAFAALGEVYSSLAR